ncbi:MAG: GDSL-type esterase/lipase family protein [Candidatus Symbiothrix sp.]|jgi:tetratricopeptide (TPR) repeat protein|nr:GDSL-type esterase/lipase family protein [Candidatus Symbiothrix sp.]
MVRKNKHTLFKLIAILLPFLALFLLEISLRVFHYGYNTHLFIEYPQNPDYYVFNSDASKRYFLDRTFAPVGNRELFKKKKAPGTLRFFVLGESTTIGYPYFHNASFHRQLLYRLMHAYPEHTFEMINLSLTAVNSYTIKGFAEELTKYQPDAVLIYAGQNEYYGALGTASTQKIGSNPAVVNTVLKLRQLKMVQLGMDGYAGLARRSPSNSPKTEKTRMELMVGNQHIERDSKLFKKGIRQFRYNMEATLDRLEKKGIPVFFSNVASNVKDQPPFISAIPDSINAMSYYLTGLVAYQSREFSEAATLFNEAKDFDLLRFRAPEEINQTIVELCLEHPNTYFVDTRQAMEDKVAHHLLGDELFTDHVHPNQKGYAIMADAFYRKIQESHLLPPPLQEMSADEAVQNMPFSPIDSIAGELRIWQLKAHWPYSDDRYLNKPLPDSAIEEKLAVRLFRREEDWLSVHNTLYEAYIQNNQLEQVAKIAEAIVLEYAEDPVFYEQTAMIYGDTGHTEKAAFYMNGAFHLAPTFERAHYLFVFYLMMDKPELATPFIDYALAHNTKGIPLDAFKSLVERVIIQKQQLDKDSTNVTLMNEIATTYRQMDNRNGAGKYINKVLQQDPKNRDALEMNKNLN